MRISWENAQSQAALGTLGSGLLSDLVLILVRRVAGASANLNAYFTLCLSALPWLCRRAARE